MQKSNVHQKRGTSLTQNPKGSGQRDGSGLIDEVRGWLNRQGYPQEMRVAQTLLGMGPGTRPSVNYQDPVSGKYREIDVVADVAFGVQHMLRLQLVIECYSSTKAPWLVLGTEPDSGMISPLVSFRSLLPWTGTSRGDLPLYS